MKVPLPQAREALAEALPCPPTVQEDVFQALGRILAEDVVFPHSSPLEPVSAMDGVAVRATGTKADLVCVGESAPERPWGEPIAEGTCVQILTGAPLPEGADAVVPMEQLKTEGDRIHTEAARPGDHVVPAGAAYKAGTRLVAGTRLGPGAVEALASAGMDAVPVRGELGVRVVPVGDELVDGTIRDTVCPTLWAWLESAGFPPSLVPPVADRRESVEAALRCPEPVVITTGGTGPSRRDIIKDVGAEPLFEGVQVKPGKPSKVYRLPDGRVWVALPGNPSAALLVFRAVVLPALYAKAGAPAGATCSGILAERLPAHRERWRIAPVRLSEGKVSPVAEGPSVASGWWIHADGVVVLSPAQDLEAGAPVEVLPW